MLIYKVTLEDGTVLENLTINGNNFVSQKEIDTSVFDNNLGNVKIEYTETPSDTEESIIEQPFELVGTHTDLQLIQCMKFPEGWMFILAKPTHEQKVNSQIADIVDVQSATEDDITDIQEALVDIYEQIIGE